MPTSILSQPCASSDVLRPHAFHLFYTLNQLIDLIFLAEKDNFAPKF